MNQIVNSQINLYFLSSVAQSMATLFVVGGVFAIYQFQKIENLIQHTCTSFKNFVINRGSFMARKEEASEWLNKDVKDHLLFYFKKLRNENPKNLLPEFVDYYCQLETQESFKVYLLTCLWLPTILVLFTFCLSLCLLFYANLYSELSNYPFLILIVITLYSLVRYAFIAIGGPEDVVINNPITSDEQELNQLREGFLKRKGDIILEQYCVRKKEIEHKMRIFIGKVK